MSSRVDEDDIYTSLPPKLPPKRREEDSIEYIVDDRPHRPVKIHDHRNPHDEDAYPQVESSRSPRRERNGDRDRGTHYVVVNGHDHGHRHGHHRHEREYERVRVRPEPVILDIADDLVLRRERRERREAEMTAAQAEDQLRRVQADLDRERWCREREERERRALEQRRERERERDLRERERARDHERRVVAATTILRGPRVRIPREREHGDVVVVQHRTPAAAAAGPVEHVERSTLDRARADFHRTQRREDMYEEERLRGRGGGPRVVVVVEEDDDDDMYGGRGRDGARDRRYERR